MDECKRTEHKQKCNSPIEVSVEKQTPQFDDAARVAAIYETAGMVGHDLRNPLQTIIGEVYLAKSELTLIPESEHRLRVQESIQVIAKQIEYMDKIVSDLQIFAQRLEVCRQAVNLRSLVLDVLSQLVIPENIQTNITMENNLTVNVDPLLLKRALLNLMINSVQAMPSGGKLIVKVQINDAKQLQIIIEDTGVGIPEELKTKMFTPLFTRKQQESPCLRHGMNCVPTIKT